MHNPFQEIKKTEVRTFTSLPAKFRKKQRTKWSDPNRQGAETQDEAQDSRQALLIRLHASVRCYRAPIQMSNRTV